MEFGQFLFNFMKDTDQAKRLIFLHGFFSPSLNEYKLMACDVKSLSKREHFQFQTVCHKTFQSKLLIP